MRFLLLITSLSFGVKTFAFDLQPYTATYQFNLNQQITGTATRTLSKQENNHYRYQFNANPEAIVGVKEITASDIQLNIYPNPTSDMCNLIYTLNNNEFVTVNVYNTLGELVYIESKNANSGTVMHNLNLNSLPAGNYSIQVSFKNNSITKKLTIIK